VPRSREEFLGRERDPMKTQFSLVILLVLFVSGCIAHTPSINTTTPEDFPTPNFTLTSSPTETTTPTETAVPSATAAASTTAIPTIEIGPPNTPDPSAIFPDITEIHMTSETSGWAFASNGDSAHVLRTHDGGKSWRDVTPPFEIWSAHIEQSEEDFLQLGEGYFLDGDRAWISTVRIDKWMHQDVYTTRIMLSTSDGGITWRMQTLPPEGFGEGHFPGFIDPMHGWFALFEPYTYSTSYTGLYRTVDGGESWEIVYSSVGTSSGKLRAFAFGDPTTGVLTVSFIGWHSGLYVRWTHDGGTNWETQSLPIPEDPSTSDPSISYFDCGSTFPHTFSKHEVSLLVECRASTENEHIFSYYLYSTKDGGLSWQSNPAPSGRLHLISPDIGWMLGKEIHFTDNGGKIWIKINEVSWEGQFSFIDANHGWAVARNDDEIALVKTEDGGRSWIIVEPELVP